MENKYQNGKIYKVVDVGYNKCYVGSTYNSLCHRMSQHRDSFKIYKRGKCAKVSLYEMFDEFGAENCKIELIELFPCSSRDELNKQEGQHIRNNNCVNKVLVGRTMKEYDVEHKEEYFRKTTEIL